MQRVLKAKSAYTDAEVRQVWQRIGDYVSPEEAWQAVDEAAAEVRQVCGGRERRVVYGWSGGKDSVALQVVMERAGVHRCVIGLIPHLEWRTYLAWVRDHGPEGLTVIPNMDLDVRWLGDNPRYLFPRNSRDGYFWTLAGTRRAQRLYQERHRPELQVYGRRTQDGNVLGPGPYGIQRSRGMVTYSPIRHWPHELVLAVVWYAGRSLPPVYDWPHGWTAGTGSWPGRRVGTVDESWAETWSIEPDRVREAAPWVASARTWLRQHGLS